ncbi:MAG: hypothetical protein ACOCW6_03975 [Spirochaetota bacterium]
MPRTPRSECRTVSPSIIEAPLGEVHALGWVAPYAGEDWVYLTAIASHAARIVVVEAAGSYDHYSRHRAAIYARVETLSSGAP